MTGPAGFHSQFRLNAENNVVHSAVFGGVDVVVELDVGLKAREDGEGAGRQAEGFIFGVSAVTHSDCTVTGEQIS